MHKSDNNNNNNNKDTSKMQYFAAMHDCSCLFGKVLDILQGVSD